jgi:hypothetical protein
MPCIVMPPQLNRYISIDYISIRTQRANSVPDVLLTPAARRAEGTTVRALVERGLHLVLSERRTRRTFKLRDVSVAGQGLHPDAAGHSWDALRARTYQGRGD